MATRDKKRKLSAVTPQSAADAPIAARAAAAADTSRPRRLAATTATAAQSEPATDGAAARQPTSASAATATAAALAVPLAFMRQSVEANARAVTAATIAAHSRQRTDGDAAVSSRRGDTADVDAVFRDAKTHFLTSDEASWVYHVPRWYRAVYDAIGLAALSPQPPEVSSSDESAGALSYSEWFEQIWALHPEQPGTIKMYGRDISTPRFQQTYDMTMRFSGNTFKAKALPDVLRPCVETMQAMLVNRETQASYLRGALLNWYADGEHYIGPHHDADKQFYLHSPVFSLSLGATRRFVFTAKRPAASKSATAAATATPTERLELELQDGDLVVMGGTTQQTHKHALPKMRACRDKRVSITLRCFK